MFSTADTGKWLRAEVAQAQTAARQAATVAVSTIVRATNKPPPNKPATGPSTASSSGGSVTTGSTTTGSTTTGPTAGDPDVSRFAPGGEQFLQPDQTTCGSSSLVMAKMINTPDYGSAITQPGGNGTTNLGAVKHRFDQAVLAMHVVTGGWKDSAGSWQLPWPAQLGTPPWAVARQMSAAGGSGITGTSYRSHLINPLDAGPSYTTIITAVDAGQCIPLFIGNDLMARHVVLVTGHTEDDGLSVYDPSSGQWVTATRGGYVGNNIDIAGWGQPWFAVLPT